MSKLPAQAVRYLSCQDGVESKNLSTQRCQDTKDSKDTATQPDLDTKDRPDWFKNWPLCTPMFY